MRKHPTFDVNLGGGVVCSESVGGHAGVASRVVLKGFTDHQRVQVSIPPDLYVGGVVQLSAFTEPPGRGITDLVGYVVPVQTPACRPFRS